MIKTWPLLFIFSLLKRLKDKKTILFFLVFPLMSVFVYILIYRSTLINLLKTVSGYQGLWGIWGIWSIFGKWRLRWQKLSTLIFLTGFFVFSYINKERDIIRDIFRLLLLFFIFSPNFSVQYFAWIMPFLIIVRPKKYLLLIAFIFLTLLSHYIFWFYFTGLNTCSNYLMIVQQICQFATWTLFIYMLKINGLTGVRDC